MSKAGCFGAGSHVARDLEQVWLLVLIPTNWYEVKPNLAPGSDVAPKYEAKMTADGFSGCAA